ncbi:MAG TPA: sialidase family protein [Candidatus Limnocylindrales bacterium]
MNDDEMGRRLHDELHRRIEAPDTAPDAVHEHLRNLRSMQEPRSAGSRGPAGLVRGLFGVAAAVAVVALVAAGMLIWRSSQPNSSLTEKPSSSAAAVDSNVPISSIGRVDAKVGWVFESDHSGASYVRLTEDGGASWSEPRKAPPDAERMQFVDASRGWAVSGSGLDESAPSATIYRTTDGGVTWTHSSVAFGAPTGSGIGTFDLVSIHFRDSLDGELFAVHGPNGDAPSASVAICRRFSTSDGGITWSAPAEAPCLADVTFVDASFGYAQDATQAAFPGLVYVTTDGGRTWVAGSLPIPAAADQGIATVMGRASLLERRGDGSLRALVVWLGSPKHIVTIAVSDDGGRTWTTAGTVQDFDTRGGTPTALEEGHWIVVDSQLRVANPNYVYATSDGGLTWSSVPTIGLPSGTLIGAEFVNGANGWAAMECSLDGANANPCGSSGFAVFATTDGAATWTRVFTP